MDTQCGQLTAELAQTYLDMAKEEVDAVVEAAALGNLNGVHLQCACLGDACLLRVYV